MDTKLFVTFYVQFFVYQIHALSNGVAVTPPMGWSSWMVFKCNTYCSNNDNIPLCYCDNSIKQIANAMITEGYREAGYEYIILDDCWQNPQRQQFFGIQADERRFPTGISTLAQYVHSLNLKLGIFSDLGLLTGQGFPGSFGYYETDAFAFTSWGVDYVKMSSASTEPMFLDHLYQDFGNFLLRSPRPILYAVSWPVYKTYYGYPVDYNLVRNFANTWRFYGDVNATWSNLLAIMDYYTSQQATLNKIAGRGGWNDADVLLVGNRGLSYDQCKVQMAIWCIIAAPLIISTDIRNLDPQFKAILLNREAIAIDQDQLGLPGYRIFTTNNVDVWVRKISPLVNGQYSYAIAFVNRNEGISPITFTVTLAELDLNNITGYFVKDVYSSEVSTKGTVMLPTTPLQMSINPTGVMFFKAEVIPTENSARSVISFSPEIIRYRH